MASVRSSVGLRFSRALDASERSTLAHVLSSSGAQLASWRSLPEIQRTFAVATILEAPSLGGFQQSAVVDEPPCCILEVCAESPSHRTSLLDVFGGPGRPAGSLETVRTAKGVLVVWDDTMSPLSLLVDLAAIETGGRFRITALLPLSDRSVARLGGELLGLRDFDESRFIETHLAAFGSQPA